MNVEEYLRKNKLEGLKNRYYEDAYYRMCAFDSEEYRIKEYTFEGVVLSFDYDKESYFLKFKKEELISAYFILRFHFNGDTIKYNGKEFLFENSLEGFQKFRSLVMLDNFIACENLELEVFSEIISGIYHIEDKNNTDNRNIELALIEWDKRK